MLHYLHFYLLLIHITQISILLLFLVMLEESKTGAAMNSSTRNTESPAQCGTHMILRFVLNQHSMKRTGILFTHGCEILCWGLLFLSNDVYSRHSSVELFLGLLYIYVYIRTVNLDVLICSMGVEDGFYWNRLTHRQRAALFGAVVLLNIVFVFPMLLFLTLEQMLLSVILLVLVLPAIYKEIYHFFLSISFSQMCL